MLYFFFSCGKCLVLIKNSCAQVDETVAAMQKSLKQTEKLLHKVIHVSAKVLRLLFYFEFLLPLRYDPGKTTRRTISATFASA